jgi:hypothetical protein
VAERRGQEAAGLDLLLSASPTLANAVSRSSQAKVSATASWCASTTACRVPADPSAHSGDADLTGVNTRS